MVKKIKIYDGLFTFPSFQNPKPYFMEFEWIRPYNFNTVIDSCIMDNFKIVYNNLSPIFFSEQFFSKSKYVIAPRKIGLIMEPLRLHPEINNELNINKNYMKYILTHDRELIKSEPNKFLFYPFGGTWIEECNHIIYEKTMNISACFSNKKTMKGHFLRHKIYSNFVKRYCEFFGEIADNKIENKLDSLKNFRFHFAIENVKQDDFFTEKLLDCFLTGTIPIYYGTDNIGKYFDTRGMIIIQNYDDIIQIITELNKNYYMDKIEYIKTNFEEAKKYIIPENWIY